MRILILANIGSGLYKFRRELLEELNKENDVFFCVPHDEFVDKIEKLGCYYIPCKSLKRRSTNPIRDIRLLKEYKSMLRRYYPDIVLTYTIKPNVYGGLACQSQNIPFLSNVTGLGTTIENGGILAKISTTLYRIGLQDAACVFFQNEVNKQLFTEKRIVKGKTRLIPGSGVNVKEHNYEPYPTEENGLRFLFVGRIMKDKGIEELLSAIKELYSERKDVFLDVVGFCDEDYSRQLEEAEGKGYVHYHGMQSDVHSFYKNCHCVVLPSYHEGMANVLLEASSTGRPVIATRIPGCKETFDEGVTGFGCEVRDVNSLKEAMLKFLSIRQTEREQMGKAAREKIVIEYDREKVINAYKEEIQIAIQ